MTQFRVRTLQVSHKNNQVNPVKSLRKGLFKVVLVGSYKASIVGFTLVSRSYYYLRDEVPAPRSRPTTVRRGNGGLYIYKTRA